MVDVQCREAKRMPACDPRQHIEQDDGIDAATQRQRDPALDQLRAPQRVEHVIDERVAAVQALGVGAGRRERGLSGRRLP
jgi:hypothetical protein